MSQHWAFMLVLMAVFIMPAPAVAQDSGWGVVVSVTPNWNVADRTKYFFGADEVSMEGSEFGIGIARGREQSGDWGVSYVRMSVDDGSEVSDAEADCESFSNGCFLFGERAGGGEHDPSGRDSD
jgi:hypothetical protein